MFVKRRPHAVNRNTHLTVVVEGWRLLNPRDKSHNDYQNSFERRSLHTIPKSFGRFMFKDYHPEYKLVSWTCADRPSIRDCEPARLCSLTSHWNIYFESAKLCCLWTGTLAEMPLLPELMDIMNVHIVTRRQARLEATAIFMGYVRRALKKHIAKSDNLRVILQCIEQYLIVFVDDN